MLTIAAVLLIAAGIVYKLWTQPREKAEDVKGLVITAPALAEAFDTNEQNANTLYLNKAIEVSGTIAETEKNQDGGIVILLDSGNPDLPVQCTMREKGLIVEKGKTVTIKGFCSGSSITGVLLTDCILKAAKKV